MIKLLGITILIFLTSNICFADFNNSESDYYDFLTKKTIEDFNAGVEHYNKNKSDKAPGIYKDSEQKFTIVIKPNKIHFTVLNYIKDEMYVNDLMVTRSKFGLSKSTTYFHLLISDVVADDSQLDAETTKIILTALGGLEKNLEEVGMTCFMKCERDVKKNNRKKIYDGLTRQHDMCDEQLNAQADTIEKYPSYNMVSLLHSTLNPEFASIKNFIQKISESNAKKVKDFMTNKMIVTKNYQTCVEVITSGTAADGAYNSMQKGMSVLLSGGAGSMVVAEEIEKAKAICVKMEELRTCLVSLKKNLSTINSLKRTVNKSGYNVPLETLPDVKNIDR